MTTVPLLPSQAWFLATLNTGMVHPGRWTLNQIYRLNRDVTGAMAEAAVAHLWSHHDSLRARFRFVDGQWRQEIETPQSPPPILAVNVSLVPDADRAAYVERLGRDLAASLNIGQGPLVRFMFVSSRPGAAPWLIVVAHHLVLDYFSLRIVADDLAIALAALRAQEPVQLPRTAGFAECAEALHDYAARDLRDEWGYWDALPWRTAVRLPAGPYDRPANAVRLWRTTTARSPSGASAQGRDPVAPEVVGLGAVGAVLTEWAGGRVWIQVMHHGRNLVSAPGGRPILPPRAWRTVGWFATAGLRLLPAYQGLDVGAYLDALAAETPAPNHGLGLCLMRWLTPTAATTPMVSRIWADSRVVFDYSSLRSGGTDTGDGIREATEQVKGYYDLLEARSDLYVRVRNLGDQLSIHWDHDPTVYPLETIGRLASRGDELLRAHAGEARAGEAHVAEAAGEAVQ
ncbi:hypothetical protein I0C86_14210 [Plantactinospora sp. S1510]|uniref:Condensation domain-containing protein n=1 Tax=Plantactinospora alkalitolerans TaxID=2789879 RepID=A0ABS0GVS3_9ACTN|nr:condensation domain-containing protein [Plantactinospora alkalitolerans]MBF9130103.1 hypothetical protein [Plantactinospora alkalitolerans]